MRLRPAFALAVLVPVACSSPNEGVSSDESPLNEQEIKWLDQKLEFFSDRSIELDALTPDDEVPLFAELQRRLPHDDTLARFRNSSSQFAKSSAFARLSKGGNVQLASMVWMTPSSGGTPPFSERFQVTLVRKSTGESFVYAERGTADESTLWLVDDKKLRRVVSNAPTLAPTGFPFNPSSDARRVLCTTCTTVIALSAVAGFALARIAGTGGAAAVCRWVGIGSGVAAAAAAADTVVLAPAAPAVGGAVSGASFAVCNSVLTMLSVALVGASAYTNEESRRTLCNSTGLFTGDLCRNEKPDSCATAGFAKEDEVTKCTRVGVCATQGLACRAQAENVCAVFYPAADRDHPPPAACDGIVRYACREGLATYHEREIREACEELLRGPEP